MSYSLKIDEDAFKDIQKTTEWYELQLKGLGLRYKTQTKKQINALKKDSYLFSIKYNSIRVEKLKNFLFLFITKLMKKLKQSLYSQFFILPEIQKFGKETISKSYSVFYF